MEPVVVVLLDKAMGMTRTEAANRIAEVGGVLEDQVTASTKLFVVPRGYKGETVNMEVAKRHGIRIMDERKFKNFLDMGVSITSLDFNDANAGTVAGKRRPKAMTAQAASRQVHAAIKKALTVKVSRYPLGF